MRRTRRSTSVERSTDPVIRIESVDQERGCRLGDLDQWRGILVDTRHGLQALHEYHNILRPRVGCCRVPHRVVHGSDGPAGRVGSGRVGSRFCWILAGRVGSGQHFGFLGFLLIIFRYLNRFESSNTAFGFIDFLRYLIYNN